MDKDDERNKQDREDPTTTKIDQSSFTISKADNGYGSRRDDPTPDTIATADHGYGSRMDDPTPETIATADGGNGSQRDEPMPDTIATADRGYGSRRDDPTPEIIATADGGNGSQRDEPMTDTIAIFDSGDGRDTLDDKSVGKVGEGCVMQVNSEMIQQHQQTDMRLTLTGDGPTFVGKHSTVIYNVRGRKRKHDTTESSGCRDNPSSKRPNYETKTISEYGCSSSGVSEAPCFIETLVDGDNSIVYDSKSDYMDTSDCSGYSSGTKPNIDAKPILEHGSSSFTDRVTPNITEKFKGGACNTRYIHAEGTHLKNVLEDSAVSEFRQGDLTRPQHEVIQVQNRSNIRVTSKGAGPNLIGKNSTVVYNINEGCSEAIEDSNREIREVVYQIEPEMKKAIAESEERIVEKISQQMEVPDFGKSTHACDPGKNFDHDYQHWLKEQKRMMHDLCDISEGHDQRMKQHEEMIMSSIKRNENMNQAEQRNIISQTENWVQEQRSTFQFVMTKAFGSVKEKIKEKRFVVIRGDSGSGKTRLATELLDWLHSSAKKHKFNCKKPLRLPSLQRWDEVISANSNLSILLDDLLGYSSDLSQDLTWWKQHGEILQSIVVGKESANYLIITLRNDIYYEYKSKFDCLSLFDDGHVIDLSSPEYILQEERETLLTTYTQTIDKFEPFSESEINQIVSVSPPIGFPECCRIFRKTPDLHPKRVRYFERPLQSIRSVITEKFNRAKQTALIYILLSREPVSTKLLDFEHECFDKEGIAHAFSVSSHVFPYSNNITVSIATQLQCLQEGLEVLCGSFVRKEKGIYKFFHDSIQDVIAILYGKKTPRGFLNNCPSSCLHYVATTECKDILHKVVIGVDNYEIAYQRIVRELDSKQHSSYIAVSSMSSWNSEEFLTGFFYWLKSKKYSTEDYFIRLETGELLMYSDNRLIPFMDISKKRVDTPSCFLIYAAKMNSINLLSHIANNLDILNLANHMKYALDVALSEGSVECSTYLLNKNIEPDGTSCFYAALGGNIEIMKVLDNSLKKLTDCEKWDILCAACVVGQHEMCAYLLEIFPDLLSRRAKNNNDHLLHIIAKTDSIDCFRTVANLFIQNCQSDEERKRSIKLLTDQNGSTVLHLAFQSRQRHMIVYLMKQYPYLLTQKHPTDLNGLIWTALSFRFGILSEKDIASAIKIICQNEMMESLIDEDGDSILHWVCRTGNEELCVKLLPICPAYFQKNCDGVSCLHHIACSGKIECFKSAAAFIFQGKNNQESEKCLEDNDWDNTVLHLACANGQKDMCLYLIEEYPTLLYKKDQYDHHCLHFVASSGNVECFKSITALVLKDMNETEMEIFMETLINTDGWTVLHLACAKGHTDMCLYLIREYPRLLSQKDRYEYHCLHSIAESGNVECFRSIAALVLKDMNETKRKISMETLIDKDGRTVFHCACFEGNKAICLYLIEEYPQLLSQKDKKLRHCLHFVAESGNVECFQSIAAIVLKDMKATQIGTFMETLIDKNGWTILHRACLKGNKDTCLFLIEEYPGLLSEKDENLRHCLHFVAESGNVECFQSIAALVLKDMNETEREIFMETLIDKNGRTVFHCACFEGNTDICLYLIEEYPQLLSQKDKKLRHCLHFVAESGNVECFQSIAAIVLKDMKATQIGTFMETLIDKNGWTILHRACLKGNKDTCLFLIEEYPGLLSEKDENLRHCLHFVAESGNVECFQSIAALVLKDMNETEREIFMETLIDKDGWTVFHHACIEGNKDICLYLIKEYPSLLSEKDENEHHCLHFVAEFNNVEFFQAISALALKDMNKTEKDIFMETLIDKGGLTVLHQACLKGNKNICLYLIEKYPTLLYKKDRHDHHCLHFVASSGNVECFQAIAALVQKDMNKGEMEIFIETLINKGGWTVLHHACLKGHKDICLHLIGEYPRLLSKKESHDRHCLHFIANSGNVECFESIAALVLKDMNETEREIFMETLIDKEGCTVFHHVCLKGNTNICLYLLREYPRLLYQKDRRKQHCLHLISESGNLESFQAMYALILKHKNKAERGIFMETLIDKDGWTVLHHACLKGNRDICLYLIEEYPRLLSMKDRCGQHCLHLIAESGNIDCFKSIAGLVLKDMKETQKEAFVETLIDNNGWTVLHRACIKGNKYVCLYLIDKYPRLLSMKDRCEEHCLHLIAESGNIDCFQSIAALVLKDMNEAEREISMETLVNTDGWTVLHIACIEGNKDICLYLIDEYPRLLSKKNLHGPHCLHLIAKSGNVECFKSVAALVLKDMNATEREIFMETLIDKDGWTVLNAACLKGNKDICLYLIGEYPRLLSKKGRLEQHCLHFIAASGNVDCFRSIASLVLKDMNEKETSVVALIDKNGLTVLHHACLKGNKNICLYLIGEYPRLLSQKDRREHHCLHFVAASGNVDCFKLIAALVLKDMNEAERKRFMETLLDENRNTVLHYACGIGQSDMYMYLISEFPCLLSIILQNMALSVTALKAKNEEERDRFFTN